MVQRWRYFGPRSQRSLAVLHAFLVNVAGVPRVRKPAGDSATGERRRAGSFDRMPDEQRMCVSEREVEQENSDQSVTEHQKD